MTYDEFTSHMRKLQNVFGERSYPSERCKVIWNLVSSADEKSFGLWITHIIGEASKPPMMPEFKEFFYTDKRNSNRVKHGSGENCLYCGGHGQLLAHSLLDEMPYAFICSFCTSAERLGINKIIYDKNGGETIHRAVWSNERKNDFRLKIYS